MGVNTRIDVSEKDLNNLHQLLTRYLPNTKVWAFGSRVKWTSRPDSDLDLVVFTTKEQNRQVHNLKDALQESSLPFRVDVLVWDNIPDTFRENIQQQYFVLVDLELPKNDGVMISDVLTFGDCASLVRASTLPSLFPDMPYIALEHIEQGSLSLNGHGFGRDADSQKTKFSKGDILFGKLRPYFRKAVIAPFDGLCSTDIWAVRPTQDIDRNFLFYWMASEDFVNRATDMSEGTRMPRAKWDIVSKFQIPKISFDEQVEIGKILRSLDDRITLLRETNATLEAIAQALFKSWFVDFDPVHAKMQGTQPEGMDEQTAALFPDSFEESELGLVPAGWEISALYDLAEYINGAAYKAFEPNLERRGLPIIKIAELKAGVTNQTAFSDVKMAEKFRINMRDILFSWSGNPDTSIDTFVWSHETAWLNQHIFRVVPNSKSERSFALLTLKYMKPIFAEIARNKQTTGLGHVTVADLKRLQIIKPNLSILQKWSEVVDPIVEQMFIATQQAQTLADLRDTLLPRLISGQLRVGEI